MDIYLVLIKLGMRNKTVTKAIWFYHRLAVYGIIRVFKIR